MRNTRRYFSCCMDARLVRYLQTNSRLRPVALCTVLLLCGCQGRTLVGDNPVFSELPPRRALVNNATREQAAPDKADSTDSGLALVSLSSTTEPLEGNAVVAEINGRPLFVDDLVGSIRLTLEADSRMTTEQRNQLLLQQIRQRLDQRVEEEIVLQALEARVPEEQREGLQGHIEDAFQGFLKSRTQELMGEGKIQSADELDQFLAQGGMSVGLLRETFFRIQMVNGYMQSLTEDAQSGATDRLELLEYYRNNIDEFTPQERLRWQEIRVSLQEHGGVDQARQRMQQIRQLLNSGQMEFGQIARQYSDSLTAEENGNRKWLTRGALRDKELEDALFALPGGGVTPVMEDDEYLSIYHVARHEYAEPRPFPSVQSEIEAAIRQKRQKDARTKVMKELRAATSVRTIFDGGSEL